MQVALERLLEERGCEAFSTHFDAIGEDGRFARLPFAAASSLMAKGYGFAGEGDMLTAALVRAGHVLIGDAHFTEMYAMDFPTDSVLMSHMGEGNWRIARADRPVRLIKRPIAIGGLDDPPTFLFEYQPGPATLATLVALGGESFRLVVCEGENLDGPELPGLEMPCGRFRPDVGRARLPRRLAAARRPAPPGDEPRAPRRQLARVLRAGRGRVRADRHGARLRAAPRPARGRVGRRATGRPSRRPARCSRRTSSGVTSGGDGGACLALGLHHLQHQAQAAAADLAEVLAHRGQGRGVVLRLGDVVEPDHADLARDLVARLVQRAQHAEGHLVVGDEDRADAAPLHQPPAQLVARARAPVAEQDRRHVGAGGLQAWTASRRCAGRPRGSRAGPRCARRSGGRARAGAGSRAPRRRTGRRRRPAARPRDRPRPPRAGASRGRATSASPAPSSGAITRMPSTPCMRSRSTALSTEARSSASRLTIVMK